MTRKQINLDLIDPNPWQPRTTDDPEHVQNLAISIAKDGLLQPPVARKVGERYQLAFGHSRFKAMSYLYVTAQTDPAWFTENRTLDLTQDFSSMPLEIVAMDDEAMYRHAISENLQRKDLSAIEEAHAMQRAMMDFGYTSAQVGELFGKNEATVRGMVRLLELPPAAQDLLDRGEISQNAARALLSMQKVAPEEAVEKAAREINKRSAEETPESVVENAIQYRNNTFHMWEDGRREGKPRGDWHNSWLLDMKNFPNALLPSLGIDGKVIGQALDIAKDDQMLAKANSLYMLKTGQLSEEHYGKDNTFGLAPALIEKLNVLMDPPACTACPFYTKLAGTHWCGLKVCHDRKTIAWHAEMIRAASKDLKIAPYEDSDGQFKELDCHNAEHEKLFKKHADDLRLIERNRIRNYPSQYGFKGVQTDVFVVVVIGKTLEAMKEIARQERAASKAGKTAVHNRQDMLRDMRERLLWEATLYFSQPFAGMNYAVIKVFEKSYWPDAPKSDMPAKGASEDVKANYWRRRMARELISRSVDTWQSSLVKLADKLVEAAAECGLDVGQSLLDTARDWDAEIERTYPANESNKTEEEFDEELTADLEDETDEELEGEAE